jgi:hypothetical protein
MNRILATVTAAAALFGATAANAATTFIFKGDMDLHDVPTGNFDNSCGSVGDDICSVNHALGLSYSKDGIQFTAFGFANNVAARLIQDISPDNSGIGVLSEADPTQDQTQFDTGEVIEFLFNQVVTLLNIEFNAGDDVDCSSFGSEGPCGNFDLFIDNVFIANIAAVDLIAGGGAGWTGTRFSFRPTTAGAGFNIAQFTVDANVIPVPAALPLLLSGLAGLAFASRRKKIA